MSPIRSWWRALLRVPLFAKIVVANAIIVAASAVAGAYMAQRASASLEEAGPLVLFAVVLAVLASVLLNGAIVWLALRPLAALEDTAARVAAGDLAVRAPVSPLADSGFERVVRTFNNILDSAESNRRRLREVAARSMHAAEEERLRISRDLHDGVAQALAAMRVRLRLARSASKPEDQDGALSALSVDLGEAIDELRRIALGLRPPALDLLGLGSAVESLARSVGETTRLDVDVHAAVAAGRRLTPDGELALYRILQEALTNVVRHAAATRVEVRLADEGGSLVLTVADDGHGFAARERMAGPGGLGLLGMQERAAYVGGSVEIVSEPGAGTRVRVVIPVPETS